MPSPLNAPRVIRFGLFELDLSAGELRKEDRKIKLQEQPSQVLVLLLSRPGEVVTREELQEALWPGDTFVEFDQGLNTAIKKIRNALGDSADNPRFIQTVARKGYRFIAPVSRPEPPAGPTHSRMRWILISAGTASIFIGLGIWVTLAGWRITSGGHEFRDMQLVRVTTDGRCQRAAISPDGKYVCYVTSAAGQNRLHLRQIATGSDVELPAPASELAYLSLRFSPDGDHIYWVRGEEFGIRALYSMPALGGSVQQVWPIVGSSRSQSVMSPVSLSSDGTHFAFLRGNPFVGVSGLYVASVNQTGERKLCEWRFPHNLGYPSWSPDGRTIAIVDIPDPGALLNIVAVPAKGGTPQVLTQQPWEADTGLDWSPDGRDLIISAAERTGVPQIRMLSYPGMRIRRITNDLDSYVGVSLSSDSKSLVSVRRQFALQLWTAKVDSAPRLRELRPFGRIITHSSSSLEWTPDGKLIYDAPSSTGRELWIMDSEGGQQRQLTKGGRDAAASVSPDGKTIVFSSDRGGHENLWRMGIDGRGLHQLTFGGSDFYPRISHDGQSVVYLSLAHGSRTLENVPLSGGAPTILTDWAVMPAPPAVSPNGQWVAFVGTHLSVPSNQIVVIPVSGGAPYRKFDLRTVLIAKAQVQWTPDSSALTYLQTEAGVDNIWRLPLSGSPTPITHFADGEIFNSAWSKDGQQLAILKGTVASDVVLLRNFR